jgi:uncharacterized membrane protein YeaQ/YmgE (transglycosylase-associated protein family)
MLHILAMIIIGFIAGVIAKFLTPGRDPQGFIITTLIGIAGSFIAKYVGEAIHLYQPGQRVGLLGSIVGAVILLVIYHLFRGKSQSV